MEGLLEVLRHHLLGQEGTFSISPNEELVSAIYQLLPRNLRPEGGNFRQHHRLMEPGLSVEQGIHWGFYFLSLKSKDIFPESCYE